MTELRASERPGCTLRIGELVLHGFAGIDRHAVADAMQRELGRLLAGAEAWRSLAASGRPADGHRLDVGQVSVAADASPEAVGIQIARAIHGGLTPSAAGSRPVRSGRPQVLPMPPGPGGPR
uniref:hypothetical protein n=1 Tax=Bradyrhizobium sp. (strain ORS 278) TaxID=114615 RepID=UPI0005A1BEC5|nr:hypothetical protein [Bradyrhizobium sp. ORS 278]